MNEHSPVADSPVEAMAEVIGATDTMAKVRVGILGDRGPCAPCKELISKGTLRL